MEVLPTATQCYFLDSSIHKIRKDKNAQNIDQSTTNSPDSSWKRVKGVKSFNNIYK